MNAGDTLRSITRVTALDDWRLRLDWSDGTTADISLADTADTRPFAGLRDPAVFAAVAVGDWGHSLSWPGDVELGADALWLETLSATGRNDARHFAEWRMRHGLSLAKAASALGISRRSVAYYSNGDRPVPRAILLACRGWEADQAELRAA